MKKKLKLLYREVILQHNKSPYHFEKKENWEPLIEANNPLCGDRFQLYLQIEGDCIRAVYFHGFGCAISKASTSILSQKLEGRTKVEAREICTSFLQFIDGENRALISDDAIQAFAAVDEFPARKDCAVLAWVVLNDYLSKV